MFNALVRDGALDLTAHDATAQFSERLSAFLQEFGSASWQEDPSTPLSQLKDYVWLEDAADPFAAHEQQADDRERLTGGMLGIAQHFLPISEDHNFTIDQKFTTVMRHGLLQLGDKLVADGALKDREDVFSTTRRSPTSPRVATPAGSRAS